MPLEEWTRLDADSFDGLAGKIIDFLEDTSNTSTVIYVEGAVGLGSSTILKEVAKRLRAEKLKIIHVDCSLWQSKRALQKAIAQELELPWSVMALFDHHDEEDDFDGVEQGARGVIPDVTRAIFSNLATSRTFLVVFHNGGGGFIDLQECGVPLIKGLYLWTSQVRFGPWHGRPTLPPQEVVGPSDAAIFALLIGGLYLLHEEAAEVARYTGVPKPGMSPEVVKECINYYKVVRLVCGNNHGIDWATHAANLWVCSGIIQSYGGMPAWEIAQALQTNLRLDWDDHLNTNKWKLQKLQIVPCDSVEASFFWTTSLGNNDATTGCSETLEAKIFQHSSVDKLRVIHLCWCTFSFASPPFLHCSSLSFLLLDHCKDSDHENNESIAPRMTACFQKLWVLELSYTDWYWLLSTEALQLMVELRELNLKGIKHWSISHLSHDDNNANSSAGRKTKLRMLNLVKLRVTAEPTEDLHESPLEREEESEEAILIFPNLSSWRLTLSTIILEGCVELKRIGPHVLPPSLESFSFSSSSNDNAQVSANIESISFQGCAQLKSFLLRGLFEKLLELDMSGTSVKTIDLRAMRGTWSLEKLFLLGCVELRAILWPEQYVRLEVLHIDATRSDIRHGADVAASSSTPSSFKWHISLRDRRLLRSLNDVNSSSGNLCIEISSLGSNSIVHVASDDCCEIISKSKPAIIIGAAGSKIRQRQQQSAAESNKLYADVDLNAQQQHLQLQATMHGNLMWPCELGGNTTHYISLKDERRMSSPLPLPSSMCETALGLHVHDSISITSITSHSNMALRWRNIRWCRVERCPNIEGVVFTPPSVTSIGESIFMCLKTFWASQLARVRCIWDWRTRGQLRFKPGYSSFQDLQALHLDCCPRLIFVLPLYYKNNFYACRMLETLEIVCCGDLKDVFSVVENQAREFPALRRIHLHDLPSLQTICGQRMVAPKLETIKIRGCWGLTRLPAVGHDSTCKPNVECEKEWWDALQWDGLEKGHHPSLYEPTHPLYYKNKNLSRGSVIRWL
ncbi:uncharacterized protein LOC102720701 isoform X1 [Oryza brachyantha]|uniref:uncharacterized protein LOC102720701 isoform X1 n=2 Tax=Oryza brachyantha TaxID=4533 RepID=UPI001ADD4144|nr:uncharacterized protein LOC102720701 isoform X1 [Oryza brachyantha]